jgi:hypothetical protein
MTQVYIRELSAADRDAFDDASSQFSAAEQMKNFRSRWVACTACEDPAGTVLIFSAVDRDALGNLPAADILKLYAIAAEVNGLTGREEAAIEKKS